jgi:hypothetical protein
MVNPQREAVGRGRRLTTLITERVQDHVMRPWLLEKDHCQSVQEMNAGLSPSLREPPEDCGVYDPKIYGGAIAGVALLGGGLAMLLYGAQRVPVQPESSTISFTPWTAGSATGLALKASF